MNISEVFFHSALAARRDSDDPLVRSLREDLRRSCETLLDPHSEEYIDYRERRAEWWTRRQGGRRLPAAIERLAAGGILADERYTREAVEIFRTVVEHRIVENTGGTNYGRPYRTWRDNPLDAGVSAAGMAIGLDLLRPVLEEDEIARFGEYLVPFVDYILTEPPDPEEEKPDWNIAAIGLVGAALLALVLRANNILDEERFSRALEGGRRRSLLFLEKGHDGQGAFFEGPAYGSATVHYLSPLAFALARCGDRELVEHPGLARLVEGMAHEIIPGTGGLNPLNDCGDTVNVSWMSLVAAEHKSGLAQWVWQRVQGVAAADKVREEFDWSDLAVRYLLYYDPSVEPAAPEVTGLPRVVHFENRGLVDQRGGWEREDFFLSFVCDVFPAGGHRQADRNQFALHALGESFAIDSGYALEQLPDTTEVLRLGALGEAHNLPLVNGEMQRRGKVSQDGIRRVEFGEPASYIEAEAGESHGAAQRFTRRVVCLPGEDGAPAGLLVADWLTWDIGESRQLLSWLLHTQAGNRAELDRDRFTIIGSRRENRCLVQMVTPWPGRWQEETFFDHPRLRYDWFWNRLLCLVALVPYRAGEEPPEIEIQGTSAGCALSATIGGRRYTIISAAPNGTVSFDGVETDAEFALVRRREEQIEGHILAAGTRLSADEQTLVEEDGSVEFTAAG